MMAAQAKSPRLFTLQSVSLGRLESGRCQDQQQHQGKNEHDGTGHRPDEQTRARHQRGNADHGKGRVEHRGFSGLRSFIFRAGSLIVPACILGVFDVTRAVIS